MLRSGGRGVKVVINRGRGGVIWEWRKRWMSEEGSAVPSQGTAPLPTGRSADPQVHSSELLGEDADAAANAASATKSPSNQPLTESEPHQSPPKPGSAYPKLEHTEVGLPSKPNTTQKRFSTNQQFNSDDISCAGLDGSPWPDDAEGQKAQKRDQEAENKEYFKHHKASPLSEIEFADTRKPVSQATDHDMGGGPKVGSYNVAGMEGLVWRPEQMEPAEVTMLKAHELWQWNKMRGDPESPHGRVLRALRGEDW